ncbi:hypothetical protein [Novosphingobium aquae]|uniref:Transposase n=1 Tax=Novosphingobium aquae TaxID=3133435 RepID=A0ABU8S6L9_9SPHN
MFRTGLAESMPKDIAEEMAVLVRRARTVFLGFRVALPRLWDGCF